MCQEVQILRRAMITQLARHIREIEHVQHSATEVLTKQHQIIEELQLQLAEVMEDRDRYRELAQDRHKYLDELIPVQGIYGQRRALRTPRPWAYTITRRQSHGARHSGV